MHMFCLCMEMPGIQLSGAACQAGLSTMGPYECICGSGHRPCQGWRRRQWGFLHPPREVQALAGPDGGDGGQGGSVILQADANATSLLDYRFLPHRQAESGTMGLGGDKDGSRGQDLILPVPVGTVVFTAKGGQGERKQPGERLADLAHAGDRFVAAQGGVGGLGNRSLATKARRAPGFALLGTPGRNATWCWSSNPSPMWPWSVSPAQASQAWWRP